MPSSGPTIVASALNEDKNLALASDTPIGGNMDKALLLAMGRRRLETVARESLLPGHRNRQNPARVDPLRGQREVQFQVSILSLLAT